MGLREINESIIRCARCPRLRAHCLSIASIKKREFRDWNYWGKPVPGFGDPDARLWIVGLAPAAHGGNRTGRVFTGDSSGDWLYAALHKEGFANQPQSLSLDDGMVLTDAYISAAGRCAPPDNKPTREELQNCRPYLAAEFEALKKVEVILALGKIAFDAVVPFLFAGKKPKFGHGSVFEAGAEAGRYRLLSSYHPSRQNTNTGKLTRAMWEKIFRDARRSFRS